MLATTHPHLRSEFLYCIDKKTGKKDDSITFNTLKVQSGRMGVWKCPKTNCENNCEHIYHARIYNRTKKFEPRNCPLCCSYKVCVCNSLFGKSKELMKEWSEKNTIDPKKVSAHSHKKALWKCSESKCEHHEWSASIGSRYRIKVGCPFCAGMKLCECYCLATEHPDLIEHEWDYDKNILFDFWKMGPSCATKVWWKCPKCNYSWQATVNSRTNLKCGCPKCAESKIEKAMDLVLKKLKEQRKIESFEREWGLKGTQMKADFWIIFPEESIMVEMDGMQHFEGKSFGSGKVSKEENFKKVQRNDAKKKAWCEKYNIRLLRLSYKVKPEHYEAELTDFINNKHVHFRLVGQ